MTRNTSSSKQSYNHLALRGNNVDDLEFIRDANESNTLSAVHIPEEYAYSPRLILAAAEMTKAQAITWGVDGEEAENNFKDNLKTQKTMLAKKGLLTKEASKILDGKL